MPKFSEGVLRFQRDVFPTKKALFEALSLGQAPEALFVTCSDSRIETGMLTQTDPGDLFVCRNAGNIIPPYTGHTGGVTASVEFAAAVMEVSHIVVCGHTGCGAMAAALDEPSVADLPHVREWLQFTRLAVANVKANSEGKSIAELREMLTEENVILQLEHLKTHPAVSERLDRGEMKLHGWIYDIKTGAVDVYDAPQRRFVPAAEYYT